MKTKACMCVLMIGVLLSPGSPAVKAEQASASAPLLLAVRSVDFVGVTTASIRPGRDGVLGVFGLARACQVQFKQSHVCSSAEILESARTPVFPEGFDRAWVNPSIVSVLEDRSTSTPTDYILLDASGATQGVDRLSEGLNCSQWRDNGDFGFARGLTVDGDGAFITLDCSSTLPVACCVKR